MNKDENNLRLSELFRVVRKLLKQIFAYSRQRSVVQLHLITFILFLSLNELLNSIFFFFGENIVSSFTRGLIYKGFFPSQLTMNLITLSCSLIPYYILRNFINASLIKTNDSRSFLFSQMKRHVSSLNLKIRGNHKAIPEENAV